MTFDIKKRREQIGLTQQEVADFVNVSGATLSRWESGNIKNMKRDKVELLAKVLGVSPLDILNMSHDFDNNLSEQEKLILQAYRNANPIVQESVCKLLDVPIKKIKTLSNSAV